MAPVSNVLENDRDRSGRGANPDPLEKIMTRSSTAGVEPRTPPVAAADAAPLHQSIRVPVEPARAFEIFTAGVREWWIPSYSINPTKAPIADVVLEPRVGGRWYERGEDGSECEWARVLAWEPAERLVVEWHAAGEPTELEVRFHAPAPRATVVTVVHRGFERFGDAAARMRAMHDEGWSALLSCFATVAQERGAAYDDRAASHGTARAVTDGETVLATMDLPATPARLFRALTTAEVEHWWGAADTYRITEWSADVRVGGRWSAVVRLPDGGAFPASGEFLAIDAPHRFVQTRRYDWDYPELGRRDTIVTFQLDPISTGTRVTVRQDGFAGLRGPADHHAEGWVGFLGYLAAYVRAERA